jgi:hypothetical protein
MKIIPVSSPLPLKSGSQQKPGKIQAIISRKTTEVITECGCVVVPGPVIGFGDKTETMCDQHGWQRISRRARLREIAGMPEPLPLPEEPSF